MSNIYDSDIEAAKRAEWNRKIAQMKREKQRAMYRRRVITRLVIPAVALLAILITIIVLICHAVKGKTSKKEKDVQVHPVEINIDSAVDALSHEEEPAKVVSDYTYVESEDMDFLAGENMQSTNAILVNIDTKTIEGQVDYKARMIPASMTKVMTVLVAAEHIEDMDKKVTMSIEATDFAYSHDCSSVGFLDGEVVTMDDLFYGTILCSGGDAAAQLAIEVAGSQEAFVDMMNEKCEELGIAETTHFTNTVGLFDNDHYSTCYDMAVIMNAAVDNEYCKKIMAAKKYTTSSSVEHPEGISISNWFLRRIEDKDAGCNVMCAKTGYVVQSGNCGVSYAESPSGTRYVCVTANAHSAWRCIYDHVDIYKNHTI